MALAKQRMSSVQTCIHDEELPTLFDNRPNVTIEEGNSSRFEKAGHDGLFIKNVAMIHSSSPHGSPSSANSKEFEFLPATHQSEEALSLINFKAAAGGGYNSFIYANNGSFLCFQQSERIAQTISNREDYSSWDGNLSYNSCQWNNEMNPTCSSEVLLIQDMNSFRRASNFGSTTNTGKENIGNWLYSEATMVADNVLESGTHDGNLQKRLNMEESLQAAKKQCNSPSSTKKPKPRRSSPSKDPQSIAAKQRRERISERLKILQELVPNGSKVDLVTMLEKAISYVKFLQLQVKVLATDEFWPAQGGKAPDISQVKEAIDAILSSQKDRNSSSSSK